MAIFRPDRFQDFEHFMKAMYVWEAPHDPAWYDASIREWDLVRGTYHADPPRTAP